MIIGNVEIKGQVVLAPMAGAADRAFRELCASFGACYTVSEMVSAKALTFKSEKTEELMKISEIERPCAIQLFGSDAETLGAAAEYALKHKPDLIDINMGCPAPKIANNGSGSALLKNPKLCGDIVRAVKRSSAGIPVTVKIRKGWDENSVNAVEVAKHCEQCGADAITVHGRTRSQQYSPPVDLEIIAKVKQSVSIPVIGNGDVTNAAGAEKMINQTGCDAVMIGRGALGNPWIFMQVNYYLEHGIEIPSPTLAERISMVLRHAELICRYKGEKYGMPEARKHVGWYLKGFHGAADLRKRAGSLCTFQQLRELCDIIYQKSGQL